MLCTRARISLLLDVLRQAVKPICLISCDTRAHRLELRFISVYFGASKYILWQKSLKRFSFRKPIFKTTQLYWLNHSSIFFSFPKFKSCMHSFFYDEKKVCSSRRKIDKSILNIVWVKHTWKNILWFFSIHFFLYLALLSNQTNVFIEMKSIVKFFFVHFWSFLMMQLIFTWEKNRIEF